MREILVIKPSSFGDIVHGLVVAQAIRKQVPESRISWVVRDIFAPLVESCDAINGDIFFFHRGQGLRAFLGLLREIRTNKYDVALDMQGLLRSGIMIWAANADRKIGRSDAREGASLFYRETAPLPAASRHAVDILLQFLPALGLPAQPGGSLFLQQKPVDGGSYILLCPESRRNEKVWPYFSDLAERLITAGHRTIWTGQQPLDTLPRVENLSGRTTLAGLIDLIAGATLVIANDSGPMHLAAALKRPVVALFGPTDPARFGPYPLDAPDHYVIRAPDGDLTRLTTENVEKRVLAALNSAS